MDSSAPASRTLVGWSIFLALVMLGGGVLIVVQRDRSALPPKGRRTSNESSIPQLSLEELASDFRKTARERRYKGQLVEVAGTVVGLVKPAAQGEQGKPALQVYLAPAPK